MKRNMLLAAVAAIPFVAASFSASADDSYRAKALKVFKANFVATGQAKLDRLDEDGVQAICNRTINTPPDWLAKQMEADQYAAVKWPADGKLLGDWKRGEKIAQNGKGFTWVDKADVLAGGACYNCHQISPKEQSFGSIGPSLLHFGKQRGNGKDMQEYVYSKIYNSKSHNLCSAMPRFGHIGALNESQIKDLVALLLDPESPVNQ